MNNDPHLSSSWRASGEEGLEGRSWRVVIRHLATKKLHPLNLPTKQRSNRSNHQGLIHNLFVPLDLEIKSHAQKPSTFSSQSLKGYTERMNEARVAPVSCYTILCCTVIEGVQKCQKSQRIGNGMGTSFFARHSILLLLLHDSYTFNKSKKFIYFMFDIYFCKRQWKWLTVAYVVQKPYDLW